ncbi:MAG: barstar family protein [Pseudomonadota bacterium]
MSRLGKVSIDLGAATDADMLHHLLMEALKFPGWYGCNWDAFWDAITGLVEMPEVLEFTNWQGFAARLPNESHLMRTCLEEMAQEFPASASKVFYA